MKVTVKSSDNLTVIEGVNPGELFRVPENGIFYLRVACKDSGTLYREGIEIRGGLVELFPCGAKVEIFPNAEIVV